jgi:hypothetical protein
LAATKPPSRSKKKTNGNGQLDLGEIEELAKRIPHLDDEEKRALIRQLRPSQRKLSSEIEKEQQARAIVATPRAPRNGDELHAWIIKETGYDIPRVAVCEDHCAPFDVIEDAYFNRHDAMLVLGSRESGKTLGVSILHYANAETKPGSEACTFATVQAQAKRAYKHVKSFIYTRDENGNKIPKPQIEGDPTRTETNWKTGSIIEIIIGTVAGVNSPHPHVVHADEIDIMDEEVWQQSRNMSSSGKGTDGRYIPALDIATSTRKSMKGLMQKLIDGINDAIRKGNKPSWKLYSYCVAEIAAEEPTCRCADPIERVHRLVQLGRDPRELCECDRSVQGEWREGVDRTLESVCRGRFFKSRGWMPHSDVDRKFMQNTQVKWDAEMECRRPLADGLYLENFTRQRYTVRGWIARPEYGRLTQGVDWGGAANSVIVWIQGPLNHPVELPGFDGQPVIVPQDSYVIFDQIEAPRTGATLLADMVCMREAAWRAQFPNWRVRGRFADMAGAQQRADWAEHNPPLRTQWYISRDFDPTVDAIQGLVDNGRLYVDVNKCSSLCDDFESWRAKDGKEVRDDSTHGPAASRYGLANVIVLERREGRNQTSNRALPVVKERASLDSGALSAILPTSASGVQSENWRRSYGMMGPGNPGVNDWRNPV